MYNLKKVTIGLPIFAFVSGSMLNMSHNSANYTHWLLMVLVILLMIDTLCYFISEKIADTFHWHSVFRLAYQKILLCVIIVISYILDVIFLTGETMKHATIIFYIIYEIALILSYATQMGLPLPGKLENLVDSIVKKEKKESS